MSTGTFSDGVRKGALDQPRVVYQMLSFSLSFGERRSLFRKCDNAFHINGANSDPIAHRQNGRSIEPNSSPLRAWPVKQVRLLLSIRQT